MLNSLPHAGLRFAGVTLRRLIHVGWIRQLGGRVLARHPKLKRRLRVFLGSAGALEFYSQSCPLYLQLYANNAETNLPESARRIHTMLLQHYR
jgi:hypothetical protein